MRRQGPPHVPHHTLASVCAVGGKEGVAFLNGDGDCEGAVVGSPHIILAAA